MLDIKFVREHFDVVREGARKKHIDVDLDRVLAVDLEWRSAKARCDELLAARKKGSRWLPLRKLLAAYLTNKNRTSSWHGQWGALPTATQLRL